MSYERTRVCFLLNWEAVSIHAKPVKTNLFGLLTVLPALTMVRAICITIEHIQDKIVLINAQMGILQMEVLTRDVLVVITFVPLAWIKGMLEISLNALLVRVASSTWRNIMNVCRPVLQASFK